MLLREALAGMMQLFSLFVFFAIGFVFACLPFSLSLRQRFVHILLEDTHVLVWTGLGFFALTLLFAVGFYCMSKGHFLLLSMGQERVTEVNVKILKKTILPLLSKQFGSRVRLTDVEVLKNRHLHIGLSLFPMEKKEKEETLLETERHLQAILSERFGYSRPFTVQLKE